MLQEFSKNHKQTTLIPICEIRSKSLVGHYSGKKIQITFHLVNLECPGGDMPNLLSEKLSEFLLQ